MQLEDLFEVQDMLRLIVSPETCRGDFTSIRLRLVSKRLLAAVIAAGYRPGNSVLYTQYEVDGVMVNRYCSWTESRCHVRYVFNIGLVYTPFLDYYFWEKLEDDFEIGTSRREHDIYRFTSWAEYFKYPLSIPQTQTKRFLYAIVGAMGNKGSTWFLDWLVSEHPWNSQGTIRSTNAHWIVADYAVRWDDAAFLHMYKRHFTKNELSNVYMAAKENQCQAVMQELRPRRTTRSMKRKAETDLDGSVVKYARKE